jgi:hypothetical protein
MANPKGNPQNLRPFTSETAPKGRKNAGLSIIEWRNQLCDYAADEIESVLADPKAPAAKLIAAMEVQLALKGDRDARRDLCDYTNGKPRQEITQHVDGSIRTFADGETAADNLLASIRERFGINSG